MREIIFRAKRKDNGEWVYGSLLIQAGERINKDELTPVEYRILGCRGENHLVAPKTVGQYTGLTDKNGTKIFEGDIVHWKKVPYFVRWDSKHAEFVFANDMDADYFVAGFNAHTTMKFCKVIGNVHDGGAAAE